MTKYCKEATGFSLEIFEKGAFKLIDFISDYHEPNFNPAKLLLQIFRSRQLYDFDPNLIGDDIFDICELLPTTIPAEVELFFNSDKINDEIPQIIEKLKKEGYFREDYECLIETACLIILCTTPPKIGSDEFYTYIYSLSTEKFYENTHPFTDHLLEQVAQILRNNLPPLQYETLLFYINRIRKNIIAKEYCEMDDGGIYSESEINILNKALENIYKNDELKDEIAKIIAL